MIVRGELQPGARVHEPKLATMLGVSRGSIREALHRLEGKKLVVRTPNQGASVASLSPIDLIELLELREAIEGMACRLAAENMSDAEIDKLEGLLSKHDHNGGYFQEAGDVDFHFAIAHGSRNKRLAEAITGDLYHLLRIYRYKSSTLGERAAASAAEHARILAAIRERDPDKAEMLMRLHVRRSRENLQKREFAAMLDPEKSGPAVVD
jgi:DNA-binding GntR family transcriptional regulator